MTSSRDRERNRFGPTQLVAMIAVFLTTTMALALNTFAGVEPAAADVPNNSVAHVFLNIGDQPSDSLRSQYLSFIQSLRAAAGHEFRNGVQQTQTDTGNRLIRVDINTNEHSVALWLTPNNLYVVGFQNEFGQYWDFNDNLHQLSNTMLNIQTFGGNGANNGGNLANPFAYAGPLNFGGNYNSLSQAAGRGRESMPISFGDLTGALNNLARTTNPNGDRQNVARSLMLMIQFTSEAARFWDVYGVMSNIIGTNGASYQSLPLRQQYLENSWAQISQYAYRVTQNPNTEALNVTGVGTLHSFTDVQALMAQLIGSTVQVPFTGSWDHSEL